MLHEWARGAARPSSPSLVVGAVAFAVVALGALVGTELLLAVLERPLVLVDPEELAAWWAAHMPAPPQPAAAEQLW